MKKKALVVLLAVAMIFTFATAAMAADYSDMSNATKATQDAVNRLSGLGVIDGYTDGTFGPDKSIRRDEFAKIAASAAGFASSADSMKNQATGYTDAAKGIWSTGFINIASAQGYMKGTGNGKFTPAANITNAEVLTTVLRMYGYNDNLSGPWPVNYVNQAVKDGITDDVANFASGSTATRGNVAIMVSAALDQTMMEYSKDVESFQAKEYGKSTNSGRDIYFQTLFQVAFGGEKVEKVLITSDTVAKYDAEDGVKYTIEVLKGYNEKDEAITDTFECDKNTVVNGAPFYGLKDKYATITYDKKKNAKTITVTSKDVNFTALEMTGATKVKADNATSYTLQKGLAIADVFNSDATVKVAATGDKIKSSQLNENGTISLDYDGKVYKIVADVDKKAGTAPVVVSKVDAAKEKINLNGSTSNQWKTLKDKVIVVDGKVASLEDVEAGDILTYKAADAVVVVAEGTTGEVGKNDGKKVTVGGAKYAMGATMTFVEVDGEDYNATTGAIGSSTDNLLIADDEGLYEKEATIVKDGQNAIALVVYNKKATSKHYGIAMASKTDKGDADWGTAASVESVTIYNEEGKEVTYNIDKDYDIAADANYTALKYGDAVKFYVNDEGELTDIEKLTSVDTDRDVSNNKYIDLGSTKAGVSKDAVIFNVTAKDKKISVATVSTTSLLDGDTIELGALELEGALNGKSYFAYDTNKSGDIVFAAVTDFGGSTDKVTYAIVDGKSASKGTSYITFVGDETEYKVADSSAATYATVKGGNVVGYTLEGGKVVLAADKVYANKAAATTEITKVNGTLINGADELTDDAKVFTWDADAEKFVEGEIGDIEEGGKVLTLATNDKDLITNILVVYANDVE